MIPRRVLLFSVVILLAACATNPVSHSKTCFHSHDYERDIGYCQVVRSGDVLYISGTVSEGAMPDAIRMAYGSLQAALKTQGLDFRHVMNERVYATDLDAFIKHKEIRKRYYGPDLPAATWIQVGHPYTTAFVVEIELIAEFPR